LNSVQILILKAFEHEIDYLVPVYFRISAHSYKRTFYLMFHCMHKAVIYVARVTSLYTKVSYSLPVFTNVNTKYSSPSEDFFFRDRSKIWQNVHPNQRISFAVPWESACFFFNVCVSRFECEVCFGKQT